MVCFKQAFAGSPYRHRYVLQWLGVAPVPCRVGLTQEPRDMSIPYLGEANILAAQPYALVRILFPAPVCAHSDLQPPPLRCCLPCSRGTQPKARVSLQVATRLVPLTQGAPRLSEWPSGMDQRHSSTAGNSPNRVHCKNSTPIHPRHTPASPTRMRTVPHAHSGGQQGRFRATSKRS